MIIAIAHILGSIIGVFLFGFLILMIAQWESGRNIKRASEELALALRVKVQDLEREDLRPLIQTHLSQKFSSELFKNRFSDLVGVLRNCWNVLGSLAQIAIIVWVAWQAFTGSPEIALYAWSILAVAVFTFLVSLTMGLACKLLTGRYPGEAKLARKATLDWVERS